MASRIEIIKREREKLALEYAARNKALEDELKNAEIEEQISRDEAMIAELQARVATNRALADAPDRASRIRVRTALIPPQQETPRKRPLGPTTKPVLSHTGKKKTLGPRYQPPQQQSRITPRYVDKTKRQQYGPVERPTGHKTPIRQQYGPVERPQTPIRQYVPSLVAPQRYGPVERPPGHKTPIRQQYGPATRPVIPQPRYIPVPPVFKPRKKFVVVKRPPPLPPKRKKRKNRKNRKKKKGIRHFRRRIVPDEEESKDLGIVYEEKEREVKEQEVVIDENPTMGTYTESQRALVGNKLRDFTRVNDLVISGLSVFTTNDKWFADFIAYFNKSWSFKVFPQEYITYFRKLLQESISHGNVYAIMYRYMGNPVWRNASSNGDLLLNMLNHTDLNASERHNDEFGSGLDDQHDIMSFRDVRIEQVIPKKKMEGAAGGFFPKKMQQRMEGVIDLQRYQIYNSTPDSKKAAKEDNQACLFFALEKSGVSADDLLSVNDIAFGTNRKFIPTKDLKAVADILGITIEVHYYRASDKTQKEYKSYGSGEKIHKLGMYLAHLFVLEDSEFRDWAFLSTENFEAAMLDWMLFERGKTISSLRLISRMDQLNLFPNAVEDRVGSITEEEKINIPLDRIGKDQERDESEDGIYHTANKDFPTDEVVYPQNNDVKAQKKRLRAELKVEVEKHYGPLVVYADTETYKNEDGVHIPNRLGYCTHKAERVKILRPHADLNFTRRFISDVNKLYPILQIETESVRLNKIVSAQMYPLPIIVYYHNLKYDLHALLKDGAHFSSILSNNGVVYGASIKTKGRDIQFRDSYKMINASLAEFCPMFNLDIKKQELIAYDWYTPARDNCISVSVDEYLTYMGADEIRECSFDKVVPAKRQKDLLHSLLESNAKEFEYDGETFNPWKYYEHYLRYDCKVMRAGMTVFRDRIMKLLKLDVFDSMTISTLAQKNVRVRGGYGSAYKVRGHLRRYISGAATGGRVWVNPDYKCKCIEDEIQALDARSLYSAAIVRLREEYGIPTAKFKRLYNFDREHVLTLPYFIVDIVIKQVGHNRSIPIICSKDANGVLDYSNNAPSVPVRIDKITLEDYIKYHDIDFDIISGVYISTGTVFNKLICDSTQDLYNIRDAAKDKTTKKIVKSILVSEYGKNLTKLHDTELKIIKLHQYDKDGNKDVNGYLKQYFYRNSHTIKKITELNSEQGLVELEANDRSFSYAHIGVMILSMSKRIMNEVFDCMVHLKKPLFYMDTDSCHVRNADIPEIEGEFRKRYGRELIGDNLGQFHSDFDLHYTDENGKTCDAIDKCQACKTPNAGCKDCNALKVISVASVYNGKKVYCEKLRGYRINPGTKEPQIVIGHHYRMKGISAQGIKHKVKTMFNGDTLALYEYICTNRLSIDSAVEGGRPRFKYDNFFSVYTAKTDIRTIGFGNDKMIKRLTNM